MKNNSKHGLASAKTEEPVFPAVMALMIQSFSLLACLGVSSFSTLILGYALPLYVLFLMHGLSAVGLSYYIGMDSWWRYIHVLFPIAVYCALNLHLPQNFFFWGSIISVSLFWTTFKSQVPFYPSGSNVRQQVANLLPLDKRVKLIEIGSGIGDFAMKIAEIRPQSIVSGIEIAPLPWLISVLRSKLKLSRAKFKLGNYYNSDFSQFDVVFAYLSPAAMEALWQKANLEMQAGSMLISHEFPIIDLEPSMTLPNLSNDVVTYVYIIEPSFV